MYRNEQGLSGVGVREWSGPSSRAYVEGLRAAADARGRTDRVLHSFAAPHRRRRGCHGLRVKRIDGIIILECDEGSCIERNARCAGVWSGHRPPPCALLSITISCVETGWPVQPSSKCVSRSVLWGNKEKGRGCFCPECEQGVLSSLPPHPVPSSSHAPLILAIHAQVVNLSIIMFSTSSVYQDKGLLWHRKG